MLVIKRFRACFNALLYGTPNPTLPPELEREIFELAATTYPECALSLVLVAHRALIWSVDLVMQCHLVSYRVL